MNGLRILDLTRVLAGPWATQHLADQGARVIKVEPPGGDETRGFGPFVEGQSTYFLSANRNKQAITLDLRSPAARPAIDALCGWADVIVENYRPGVMERLGLGWTDLHVRYPRLCYVAIHAFGHPDDGIDPVWTERPGYDLVLQAMGGGAAINGPPGTPPLKHALSIADLFAGTFAVEAILLALLERERTGRTQKIVVNMLQVQANVLAHHASRYTVTGEVEQKRGNAHRGLVPYDLYACADGWLALACGNDAMWARLVEALALAAPAVWSTNAQRLVAREAVDAAVADALAGLSVAEADARLTSAGVPAGPVWSLDKTIACPAVQLVTVDHEALGPVRLVGPALQTLTTVAAPRAPPTLGADRDVVLGELGLDAPTIAAMAAAGAFGRTASAS